MYGIPRIGVLLIYHKVWRRLQRGLHVEGRYEPAQGWVRNLHNDPLPAGLFIPFKSACLAVKESIETDGALPKSIEWVANKELPDGAFPDPGSPHLDWAPK
jgi:hypothetical protein